MKAVLLGVILGLQVFVAEPPEYPPGHTCTPTPKSATEHACECKRVDHDENCEGEAHDSACKQWCHENRCACPVVCHPSKG